MTILVTGGAGYIGSHTCVELLNNGYEIAVLDNLSNSSEEVLTRIREMTNKSFMFYKGDLLDKDFIKMVFQKNRIEAVIHFAGLKAVGESVQHPHLYYQNNIMGTLHLLEVMDQYEIRKIVFSSSATVYASSQPMPLSENSITKAINPYGRTKLMIEEMLADYYQANPKWSCVVLRYFNPIGAHQSGEIGEDPNGIPNNLMPYLTQVAIGKLNELKVFGNDYPTPDGTCIRDYIHVVDLAKGHIKALNKVQIESGYYTYNLGTGGGYSVLEVIQAFEKATGKKVPYSIGGRRQGDVPICYADTSTSKMELLWQATKSLEEMCKDAWNWQTQNPNGYKIIDHATLNSNN
ncbi:UDP-glucose 4-epimerase GalE [Bacillus sp. FJAT-52991]|uniref:UDP-glucose 4-epimerase n=1 Tax=Bacillus kandeliae TaxID=3129297 RepID=A0ABZ2N7F1_9BACI